MTEGELAQIAGPVLGGVAMAAPLGVHLAQVWTGGPTALDRVLGPVERCLYRLFRIDPRRRQDWVSYALGLLSFNAVAFVCVYALVRLQASGGSAPSPDAAFWYAWASLTEFGTYPGALAGLFVAGGSGLAVAAALTRALAQPGGRLIGNVWSDLARNLLYAVVPVFLLVAVALATADRFAPGVAWIGPAIVALGVDTMRFACAFAFGRMVRARSEGYALAFVMALVTGLVAWLQDWAVQGAGTSPVGGDRMTLFSRLIVSTVQGGAGPGFASLLVVALLAVCVGGMLAGRTPEYLGKRLAAREIMLVTLASLALWAVILAAVVLAGLVADSLGLYGGAGYGNVASAVVMALGRFGALIPILAIAGALAAKPRRATTEGTAWTGNFLFAGLLAVIALVFVAAPGSPPLPSTRADTWSR